jgi:hypothetical protein
MDNSDDLPLMSKGELAALRRVSAELSRLERSLDRHLAKVTNNCRKHEGETDEQPDELREDALVAARPLLDEATAEMHCVNEAARAALIPLLTNILGIRECHSFLKNGYGQNCAVVSGHELWQRGNRLAMWGQCPMCGGRAFASFRSMTALGLLLTCFVADPGYHSCKKHSRHSEPHEIVAAALIKLNEWEDRVN